MSKKSINNKSKIDKLFNDNRFTIDDIDCIKIQINKIYQEKNTELTKRELNRLRDLTKARLESEKKFDSVAENVIEIYFVAIVLVILFSIIKGFELIGLFIVLVPAMIMYAIFKMLMYKKFSIRNYNMTYIITAIKELINELSE